jgi:hypothetical protein
MLLQIFASIDIIKCFNFAYRMGLKSHLFLLCVLAIPVSSSLSQWTILSIFLLVFLFLVVPYIGHKSIICRVNNFIVFVAYLYF